MTGYSDDSGSTRPGRRAALVTPSDTVDIAFTTSSIWVGTAGNINVLLDGDSAPVLFQNVPVGFFDVQAKRVYSTSTTAAAMTAVGR